MAKQAVGEGSVRVGPLVGMPALLREFGADPAAVFASCGVDYRILDDPDNPIPYAAGGRLLSRSVAVTACPHFGLLLGQKGGAATLGVLGHLALHSPDVGTALRSLILRLHQHDRGAVPTLSVDGSHAVLAYWIYQPGVEGTDQICDLASAVNFKLMRDLCGPVWSPDEVLFAHRQPDDLTPFRRFFRAPPHFDADQTALAFASTWLSQPVAGADAHLRTILEAHLASIENLDGVPIVERLRRVLRPRIMTGRGDDVTRQACHRPRPRGRASHTQPCGTRVDR